MSISKEDYLKELEIQKKVAYLAGTFYGDTTIKTLIESIGIGIVMINEDGLIILINSYLSNLTGFDKNEVLGKPLSIIIPSSHHERHREHIKHFFNNPQVRPMGSQQDLCGLRKDGSQFPVTVSLSFLKSNGDKIGIAFVSDNTISKSKEKELKLQNEELDAYARTVAHDLSSPLAGIISLSELLIEKNESYSKEKQLKLIKQISEASQKLNSVIKNLLVFASIRKEDIVETPILMKPVIESSINRLRKQIKDKNAIITIEKPIHNCFGVESWIEEIWYNYISNALKYGGSPPIITIGSTLKENGFVEYFVTDNGVGLSEERQKEIFNTSDFNKSDLSSGFGFGLNIVLRIIHKLDGCVDVKSEKGKGSTFSFLLKQIDS